MESLFIAISSIRKGCIGKSKSMKAFGKLKATKKQILIITSADFLCFNSNDLPNLFCQPDIACCHLLTTWRVMVFNSTFKNISVISWQSVLLAEETGVHGENYWSTPSNWQTFIIKLYRVYLAMSGIRTQNFSGDRR